MKRLVWVFLLLAALVVATTGVASAYSQTVTVTANPKVYVSTGLAATYITDYEIGLSWIMGAKAANVMVRGKCGSIPTSREDGFLVYYGNATSTTHHLEQNLAMYLEPLYYVLWTQYEDGTWSDIKSSTEGNFMSVSVLFMSVSALALGLSVAWVWKRHGFLAYAATAFWLFLGLLAYQNSTSPNPLEFTDVYMGLFWVCIGMAITCGLLPIITREKPELPEAPENWEGEDLSAFFMEEEEKPKPQAQPRRLRSRFGETGIM